MAGLKPWVDYWAPMTDRKYVKQAPAWLNDERWTMPPPPDPTQQQPRDLRQRRKPWDEMTAEEQQGYEGFVGIDPRATA